MDEECGFTITRIWTAEDECGNMATAVQTIRVLDSSAPVFTTTVQDVTVDLDLGEVVPDPVMVTAFDSCGAVTVQFNETESPGFDCGYILTRTWTAEDECGNTTQLTQIVTVLKACPCVLPEIESVDLVNPDCGLKNGIITINTVNDPGLYEFDWLPNKGQSNATGNSRTNLGRGTYFVVVSDPTAKDCLVKLNIKLDPIGTCVDTMYASTGLEEAITVCTDPVLDFEGSVVSANICGFDPNEVSVSVNQNSGCVQITPLEGFTGTSEICVIHCNDETPAVCDTTYIFLTVSTVKPCEDIFTEALYNLEAPTCEGDATLCVNINPLEVQDYQILIDGVVYSGPFAGCGNDGIAISLPVGNFEVEISHLPSQCTESRIVGVSCPDETEFMAIDDIAKTRINRSVAIPVLFNDIVPANMFVKSFDILSDPVNGVLKVNEDLTVIYTPNENFCGLDSFTYQICIDEGMCDEANVIIDVSCRKLVIYNGFSPNGDNVNDLFTIEGIDDYPKNELRVFNRWGNQVYYQKGYKNSWDGTWEGGNLPDGTYFYMFDDGEGENYNGYLQILR
jgi:gliding motility-associated-like protein